MKRGVGAVGTVFVVLMLFVAAGPATAQSMMHGKGKGMGMMGMSNWLNLTADQQEQVRQIHQDHKAEMMSLQAQVRDLNVAIDNELAKDKPNMPKVKELRGERADVFAKFQKQMDAKRQAIRNVLTTEQKNKLGPCGLGACGMMGGGMMGCGMMGGGMMGGGMMGGGMMGGGMMGGQQQSD